jgi:hypothetical protein
MMEAEIVAYVQLLIIYNVKVNVAVTPEATPLTMIVYVFAYALLIV